jgi:proline racemase
MQGKRLFSVIDSHTAGHPTRVVTAGFPVLPGETVLDQRNYFREVHDELRSLLLHEPRGHAAMVAAVPVPSRVADQGIFFISSYVYLDMCGHATIGYIATLNALGSLPPHFAERGMTLETPAGVITVHGDFEDGVLKAVRLRNVPSYLAAADAVATTPSHGDVSYDVSYGGIWYGLVDVDQFDIPFDMSAAARWCAVATEIKAAINGNPGKAHADIGSVLFYKNTETGGKHLVVLAPNKFDRSPCGTGTSARIAQLSARGLLPKGKIYEAQNILGVSFKASVVDDAAARDGKAAIIPEVVGMASITAFSTLVLEAGDPIPTGFLPG